MGYCQGIFHAAELRLEEPLLVAAEAWCVPGLVFGREGLEQRVSLRAIPLRGMGARSCQERPLTKWELVRFLLCAWCENVRDFTHDH